MRHLVANRLVVEGGPSTRRLIELDKGTGCRVAFPEAPGKLTDNLGLVGSVLGLNVRLEVHGDGDSESTVAWVIISHLASSADDIFRTRLKILSQNSWVRLFIAIIFDWELKLGEKVRIHCVVLYCKLMCTERLLAARMVCRRWPETAIWCSASLFETEAFGQSRTFILWKCLKLFTPTSNKLGTVKDLQQLNLVCDGTMFATPKQLFTYFTDTT